MGEIIRKEAAVDDIFDDLNTTLVRASARGGDWAGDAETQLRASATLAADLSARLIAAEAVVEPLRAVLATADADADDLLGRVADELWNLIGRPGNDPVFAVLFPGGAAPYTDAPTPQQADRMVLLAELLESHLHPAVPAERADAWAAEIRAGAADLKAAVDAVREPDARADQLARTRTAVARAAQIQLSRLKRLYKARGFSEADIHTVIPDRPRPRSASPSPEAPRT